MTTPNPRPFETSATLGQRTAAPMTAGSADDTNGAAAPPTAGSGAPTTGAAAPPTTGSAARTNGATAGHAPVLRSSSAGISKPRRGGGRPAAAVWILY